MKDHKIVQGVKLILEGLEVDINDRNYIKTPIRVKDLLKEMFDRKATFPSTFKESYDEMILMKHHRTWTLCPHHLLPVGLNVSVAYIPNGAVVGLSKLARIIDLCLGKPVLQEQLTHEVADALMDNIKPAPLGSACTIEGRHLCMEMRGIKSESTIVTSAMRGALLTKPEARAEFLALVNGR